jgi:hypothetical protein
MHETTIVDLGCNCRSPGPGERAAGGGSITGHISRDGERIYHWSGQVNYDRLEPDQLFKTETQAEANGFRPAQR